VNPQKIPFAVAIGVASGLQERVPDIAPVEVEVSEPVIETKTITRSVPAGKRQTAPVDSSLHVPERESPEEVQAKPAQIPAITSAPATTETVLSKFFNKRDGSNLNLSSRLHTRFSRSN
jgi:hypothetical protein